MSAAEPYKPVVARLPEALQEEAEEIAEAERVADAARVERELSESDEERLERESK